MSRLTLWVNGEEREAAFAGRTQAREAYQQVVARRRDPCSLQLPGAIAFSCSVFQFLGKEAK